MRKLFTLLMMAVAITATAQTLDFDQPIDQNVPCDLLNKHGHVQGMGRYCHGATAYLVAIPDEGYYFAGWDDGSTENPRIFHVEYSLNSIFEPIPDRVPSHIETSDGLTLYTQHLTIFIDGEINADYQIFSATGALVYTGRRSEISMPVAGIYFVKTSTEVYKVSVH